MPRYVQYVGKAHRRVITSADWRSIRTSGDQMVWEASNGFAIPLELFTDDQVKRAIDVDPDLVVTDEDFEPRHGPYDMTPWELNQYYENPVDVIAMLDGHHNVSTDDSDPSAAAAPNGGVSTDQRDEILDDTEADTTSPRL